MIQPVVMTLCKCASVYNHRGILGLMGSEASETQEPKLSEREKNRSAYKFFNGNILPSHLWTV